MHVFAAGTRHFLQHRLARSADNLRLAGAFRRRCARRAHVAQAPDRGGGARRCRGISALGRYRARDQAWLTPWCADICARSRGRRRTQGLHRDVAVRQRTLVALHSVRRSRGLADNGFVRPHWAKSRRPPCLRPAAHSRRLRTSILSLTWRWHPRPEWRACHAGPIRLVRARMARRRCYPP